MQSWESTLKTTEAICTNISRIKQIELDKIEKELEEVKDNRDYWWAQAKLKEQNFEDFKKDNFIIL